MPRGGDDDEKSALMRTNFDKLNDAQNQSQSGGGGEMSGTVRIFDEYTRTLFTEAVSLLLAVTRRMVDHRSFL